MRRFRLVAPRLTPAQWLVAAPFVVLALVAGVVVILLALVLLGLVGGVVLLVRPDLRRRLLAGWRLLQRWRSAGQWPPAAHVTEVHSVIDYEESV